jgi:hypothetical protein
MDPLTPEHRPHIISVSSSGFEEFDLSEPPQSPAPIASERSRPRQGNTTQCPSCGAINPSNNRHCEECGARLSQAPLPTAPRPAVQTTAGVRAALAISGLLFAVVIIALLFNVFTGDGGPTTTTTSAESTSTSPTIEENGPLAVIDTTCSVEPVGSFSCANLTSGSDAQYQANWEDLPDGEKIVIRLTFGQPMVVQQIQWKGVTDPVKFAQNYRPRGLVLTSSDAISDISFELSDDPGLQTIPFAAIGANWIEIEIQSAYFAELTEGNVFKEIAIDEITAIGRPQAQSTTSSSTTSTTTP